MSTEIPDGPALPEWLTPGGTVGLRDSDGPWSLRVVARITKRDVVLNNGVRVRRDTLSYSRGTWSGRLWLLDPNGEEFRAGFARYRDDVSLRNAHGRLGRVVRDGYDRADLTVEQRAAVAAVLAAFPRPSTD